MSHSRRRRSPSPAKPHHAGVAYRMDATVVALATRWSSCGWRPWVRRSLNANIEEEQVFKTLETWSVMVNLVLRRTPRTLSVVTLSAPSMNGCDGGCMDLVLARVTTSSFVLDQLFRLRLVDFHVISFSPFLDVIVFIRDRSYPVSTGIGPSHCPNGRLGEDLGFGGFAFALKLPELLSRNLPTVRAKLGQTSSFPNGPQIWFPIGQ